MLGLCHVNAVSFAKILNSAELLSSLVNLVEHLSQNVVGKNYIIRRAWNVGFSINITSPTSYLYNNFSILPHYICVQHFTSLPFSLSIHTELFHVFKSFSFCNTVWYYREKSLKIPFLYLQSAVHIVGALRISWTLNSKTFFIYSSSKCNRNR